MPLKNIYLFLRNKAEERCNLILFWLSAYYHYKKKKIRIRAFCLVSILLSIFPQGVIFRFQGRKIICYFFHFNLYTEEKYLSFIYTLLVLCILPT